MNQLNHHDYYLARAEASRGLAHRAADPMIASIHFELATRYDSVAARLDRKVDVNGRGAQG